MEFQNKYKDRGLAVIGVSMDEDGWKSVQPFLEEHKLNYPVVIGSQAVAQLYGGVSSMPMTLLIDRRGQDTPTGRLAWWTRQPLRAEIQALLQDGAHEALRSKPRRDVPRPAQSPTTRGPCSDGSLCYDACSVLKIHKSAWLLVLLSAALQILVFPLPNLYMLGWVAVAPLLIGLLRSRQPDTLQLQGGIKLRPATPWQAFLLAYVCGILWYAGTCYWVLRRHAAISAE